MDKKITPQEEANFVKTLMDTDLNRHRHSWTNEDRLDYLKIIGDYVDDVGETIYRTEYLSEGSTTVGEEIKITIGEDRPKNDDHDISLIDLDKGMSLADLLLEALRPKELEGCMSPREFCRAGECKKGVEARTWLHENKYPHEYNHIHVHPYDLVLLLDDPSDDYITDPTTAWITLGGVQIEGDTYDVMQTMFHAYTEAFLKEKQNG